MADPQEFTDDEDWPEPDEQDLVCGDDLEPFSTSDSLTDTLDLPSWLSDDDE